MAGIISGLVDALCGVDPKGPEGITRIQRKITAMEKRAKDTDTRARRFKAYIFDQRLPNMWRNQGQIMGRYGGGSKKWADNKPWIARAKGFNKPLFSSPDGSSIKDSYHLTVHRGGNDAELDHYELTNKAKHVKWLQCGIMGHKRIRPVRAQALAVPWAPGVVIFLKSVLQGSRKGRWITGFIPGDGAWLAQDEAKEAIGAFRAGR